MELEASHRYRLTIWPGIPLRLPPFQRRTSYRLDASQTGLVGSAEAVDVTERHGQIYLRLYDLDLTDPDAILAFARKHGALDGRFVANALSGFSFADGRYTYTCPPYD